MTPDYHVELIEFKNGKIREFVTPNEDGSFTIFIEASLSREEQRKAAAHALRHILHDDFYAKHSADEIEDISHFI